MKSLWSRKISTVFALAFVVGTVLGTTFLVQTGVILFGGAAPSDNPQNVRITNISDTAITVTYTTDAKVIGTISIGKDKDNLQTILDERDQQAGTPQLYKVHSISVKNLKPNTHYIFSITSGATTYLNHDAYFSAQTGPTLTSTPSAQAPLSGKLIDPDGTTPQEALVYVTTDKGQVLSTLAKSTGIYTIPLNEYRTNDVTALFPFVGTTQLHILATDGTSTSQATVLLSGSSPVPLITLSQTYNFIASTTPVASQSAEAIGFPAFSANNSLEATPVIITPKKNETFTDPQPQFSGKALPNQPVSIQIHSSDVITSTVTTDALGNWTFRPSQQLASGPHTITITTKDANGILKTIEQSFTVFAAGSQVTQSATPSATPIVTKIPTPPTKPIVQTTLIPTLSPTPFPTAGAQVTRTVTPKPTLPPTGSNSVIVAGATGIVTSLIGIIVFLLSRGAVL